MMFLFAQILFRFVDINMLEIAAKGFFGLNANEWMNKDVVLTFKNNLYLLAACFIFSTPLGNYPRVLLEKFAHKNKFFFAVHCLVEAILPVALLIISANALAGKSYNPFIYFQF